MLHRTFFPSPGATGVVEARRVPIPFGIAQSAHGASVKHASSVIWRRIRSRKGRSGSPGALNAAWTTSSAISTSRRRAIEITTQRVSAAGLSFPPQGSSVEWGYALRNSKRRVVKGLRVTAQLSTAEVHG